MKRGAKIRSSFIFCVHNSHESHFHTKMCVHFSGGKRKKGAKKQINLHNSKKIVSSDICLFVFPPSLSLPKQKFPRSYVRVLPDIRQWAFFCFPRRSSAADNRQPSSPTYIPLSAWPEGYLLSRYFIPPSKKNAKKFAYVQFLLYLCTAFCEKHIIQ